MIVSTRSENNNSEIDCGSFARPRLAWPFAGRQWRRLVDKIDRRALAHAPGEIERVPVGQSDAAVRIGLADPRRVRCAVDAVALLGEVDPYQPDRILRARRDRQLAMGVTPLNRNFGS
jgi:hypothetical protein